MVNISFWLHFLSSPDTLPSLALTCLTEHSDLKHGASVQQARQSILQKKEGASSLALRLSTAAFHHSVDRSGNTPYSLGASEAFDMVYSGKPSSYPRRSPL